MLPDNVLPPEAAAAVYLQFPGQQDFRLLGAIGNEKPSAIFKVNMPDVGGVAGETVVNLGISIELAADVQAQLASLKGVGAIGGGGISTSAGAGAGAGAGSTSTAMTTASTPPSTKILAQRIIQNAFNFLSSFSGTMANGQEVIPLKSFQDWWAKFERRVENDPGFLERPQD